MTKSNAELTDDLKKKAYVSKRASVSVRTVDNWIASNQIPYVKFPTGAVRFLARDIDAFIARHRVASRKDRAAQAPR
jgi:predicted DNA-binding transcriptional regulator AlpA